MASADQIKALVVSHASGDQDRFYAVALQVAAKAARQGQRQYAESLRRMVEESRQKPAVPRQDRGVAPAGHLSGGGGLTADDSIVARGDVERLNRSSFVPAVEARLERVLMEQRRRGVLRSHGLTPIQRVLFTGAPGTGKTYAASVLAGELSIPLFVVQLDGLLSRYLGETAARLRTVFDRLVRERGVYFFDEVDAIGGEREGGGDVGEIRRVLNSFLKFLEADTSDSLLVAATNHPGLLDRALFRRFDLRVDFPLPEAATAERLLRGRLAILDTARLNWPRVLEAARGLSHGELSRAAEQAAKNAVLREDLQLSTEELLRMLLERCDGQQSADRPGSGGSAR